MFFSKFAKILLLPLSYILLALVLKNSYPVQFEKFKEKFFISELNIKVNGKNNKYLERFVKTKLPEETSVFYWFFNGRKIEKKLLEDNLFKSTYLKRCSFFKFNCYKLIVELREPSYIFKTKGVSWLADSLGVLIRPLDTKAKASRFFSNLLKVEFSSQSQEISPQTLNARVATFLKFYKTLKLPLEYKLSEVEFSSESDLKLRFSSHKLELILSLKNLASMGTLSEQLDRFNLIQKDLGGGIYKVKEIDLAFDNQGVVRFFGEGLEFDSEELENIKK